MIREATPADVPAVQTVGLLTWPRTYLPFSSPEFVLANLDRWWSADAVLASITDDTTLVEETDGQVRGLAVLGSFDGTPALWKLYVLPEHQGTGLGAALMREVLGRLPAGSACVLDVVDGNIQARAFYERFGFQEVRRESVPDAPDTVWMRREPAA